MQPSRVVLAGILIACSGSADARSPLPPSRDVVPEALVDACLARCSEESSRCSGGERQAVKGRAAGGRRYGLRRCGCAYVGCKSLCRRYGWFQFACGGSATPQPPPSPRSPDRACKHDGECALLPYASCRCRPCGVHWREAVNRAALRRLRAEARGRRCRPFKCARCNRFALGPRPYCSFGQCTVGF